MPDGQFVARLGHTHDPAELIPGNPGAVLETAETMTRFGAALDTAGTGLKSIDDGGWTGQAATAFHDAFDTEPARWKKSADAFLDSAEALTGYALCLVWAQAQAKEAIALWDQAQAATDTARAEHDAKEDHAAELTPLILGPTLPFADPGHALRAQAQAILDRARQQLHDAGNDTERTIDAARDKAPPKRKFWQQIGHHLSEFGKGFAASLLGTLKGLWDIHLIRIATDPRGYAETVQTNIQAAKFAVQHPAEFSKAVADWETWKTNPAYAAGALIPELPGRGIGRAGKVSKLRDDLDNLPQGSRPNVRTVRTRSELGALYEKWAKNGADVTPPTYHGQMTRLDDGTTIGIREDSKSGGATIDIFHADGTKEKVHIDG